MLARSLVSFCLLSAAIQPSLLVAEAINTAPAALEDGWSVAEPVEAGLDPDALADMVGAIETNPTYSNVHALLIEHEGRLVFERYWAGEDTSLTGPLGMVEHGPKTLHDLRSISKSVTSLLLGIALGDDAQDAIARPIVSFFPDREVLGSQMDAVTLHHVLTMTAGLAWNELNVPHSSNRNDFLKLVTTDDPVGFVLAKELRDKPGLRWNYNSGLTLLIAGAIENQTRKPLVDYADEVLFGPLGITEYEWLRPPAWGLDSLPDAGAGLRMRARDLAKIGSVVLHDGKWHGRQIVPQAWVATSTTRHANGQFGPYGYQWVDSIHYSQQRLIKALGFGDQRIFVLPESGLSVTIFAGNYEQVSTHVGERILDRIVKALR